MISDVLVHVDASTAGEQRLAYAFGLAAAHQARLTGAHVAVPVDLPHYVSPYDVERLARERRQEAREAASSSERMFREAAAEHTASTDWRAVEGDMSQQLCALARCADLVIVGQYETEGPAERHPLYLAEEVVLSSGRPVLAIPSDSSGAFRLRRVLIGWDGGRDAARSVHDALPLLEPAKPAIEILSMEESDRDACPLELATHLKRHGLGAKVTVAPDRSATHGGAILDMLRNGAFDLLVIGAFGHPVWHTLLFGGSTQSVLARSSTPVLVSH